PHTAPCRRPGRSCGSARPPPPPGRSPASTAAMGPRPSCARTRVSGSSPRQATSVLRDEPSARSWPRRRNEPADPRCCVAGMPVRIVDGWRKTSGTTRLFPMTAQRPLRAVCAVAVGWVLVAVAACTNRSDEPLEYADDALLTGADIGADDLSGVQLIGDIGLVATTDHSGGRLAAI